MFKLQISEYQEGLWTEWEDTDYIGENKEALELLYRLDRTEVGYHVQLNLAGKSATILGIQSADITEQADRLFKWINKRVKSTLIEAIRYEPVQVLDPNQIKGC